MKRSADSFIDCKNNGNSLCITFILYIVTIVNNSVITFIFAYSMNTSESFLQISKSFIFIITRNNTKKAPTEINSSLLKENN
jgi:hypothetical protein